MRRPSLSILKRLCRNERGAVGNFDAIDPFQGHHLAAGAIPVDRGNKIAGFGLHRFGKFGGRGGFAAQIQFARGPPFEIGDDELGA